MNEDISLWHLASKIFCFILAWKDKYPKPHDTGLQGPTPDSAISSFPDTGALQKSQRCDSALRSGKLGQWSPDAERILLEVWLPHQFLNLGRKLFSASLFSFFSQLSQSLTSGHCHPFLAVSLYNYGFPSLWHEPIFHINILLISYPTLFASLPWCLPYSCTDLFLILIQLFTSVKLNYWIISWPLILIFYIIRQELLCCLPHCSLSHMLGKCSPNFHNVYKNLVMLYS